MVHMKADMERDERNALIKMYPFGVQITMQENHCRFYEKTSRNAIRARTIQELTM
jgi:hypothetical protein